MKLKDLLKESSLVESSSQNLEELEQQLNSGKWRIERDLLYRGETFRDLSAWKIRKIRKNRKPRDAPLYLQSILDGIGSHLSTDYPLRSESKFGGGERRKEEMRNYGELKVCFPQKQASVFNMHHDTYNLFKSFSRKAKKIDVSDRDQIFEEEYPYVYYFLKLLENPPENSKKLFKHLSKHYDEILDSCVYLVEKNISSTFEYLLDFFQSIKLKYFDKLDKGVDPWSYEHIFDGQKYLLVDEQIFQRKFYFENNM